MDRRESLFRYKPVLPYLAAALYLICLLLWWKVVLIATAIVLLGALLFAWGYDAAESDIATDRLALDAEWQALEQQRRIRDALFTASVAMAEIVAETEKDK
ncbi:MAG: hypothetical protein ACRCYU_14890 [Nocardioides sp.]